MQQRRQIVWLVAIVLVAGGLGVYALSYFYTPSAPSKNVSVDLPIKASGGTASNNNQPIEYP